MFGKNSRLRPLSCSQIHSQKHLTEQNLLLFLFTALPENMAEIELRQLFLDPICSTSTEDGNLVSLLA